MLERLIWSLPALAWMTLIFSMSSREQFPQTYGVSIAFLSVVAHLLLYGVLAVLLLIAFDRSARPARSAVVAAIVIAALYGVSDEFHQSFVPGRNASAFDLAINTIGASIAAVAYARRRAILTAISFR